MLPLFTLAFLDNLFMKNIQYQVKFDFKVSRLSVQLKKEPSFWGRKFVLDKLGVIDQDVSERIMLSLMMMVLLERR